MILLSQRKNMKKYAAGYRSDVNNDKEINYASIYPFYSISVPAFAA